MIDVNKVKPKDKVHYKPSHYKEDQYENGIVKSIAPNGGVLVVYNCGGDWANYMNYTAANTNPSDLHNDWRYNKS